MNCVNRGMNSSKGVIQDKPRLCISLLPPCYICCKDCFMNEKLVQRIAKEVEEIKTAGLYKTERIIESPQGAEITVGGKSAELLRQ